MPQELRVYRWPHWAEPKGKTESQIYHSEKILGQLYDNVQQVPFKPAWDTPFDERILNAYQLSDEILDDAREIKQQYDEAVRRIMLQRGIASEFEVWSTFVLQHNQETGDYKFSELIGENVIALKEHHQDICYEKAGTNSKQRDWVKMAPFIAAMYTVTAKEVAEAVQNAKSMAGEGQDPVMNFENMPLMSFPWIFARELGLIATKKVQANAIMPRPIFKKAKPKTQLVDLLSDEFELSDLPEITTESGIVRGGEELNLMHQDLLGLDIQNDDSSQYTLIGNTETNPTRIEQSVPRSNDQPKNTEELARASEARTQNGTLVEEVKEEIVQLETWPSAMSELEKLLAL